MRDYQIKHGDSKFPPFSDFVEFVTGRWLRGPNFLWSPGAYQTEVEENPQPLDSDDLEVKRASLVTQTSETHPVHFEISQLDQFSD